MDIEILKKLIKLGYKFNKILDNILGIDINEKEYILADNILVINGLALRIPTLQQFETAVIKKLPIGCDLMTLIVKNGEKESYPFRVDIISRWTDTDQEIFGHVELANTLIEAKEIIKNSLALLLVQLMEK